MTGTAHHFPCPQCGADLRFAPEAGRLVCDHCGHAEEASGLATGPWGGTAIREQDFQAALRDQLPQAEMAETRTAHCASCGARVEFDGATHGLECPFCASPLVADTGDSRLIKPQAVIPFVLDEKAARQAMTAWLGRLWFAPSGLQAYAKQGRAMDGVYVPFWTFDARTQSAYAGERGTVHARTHTVIRDGRPHPQTVTEIRWRPVSGQVQRVFDDVLVLGARSLDRGETAALAPWDLSQLAPYAPEYLAGLRAEAYTVELDEAFHQARAQMDRQIERDVRFAIGGDRQRIHQIQSQIGDVTFKHVLLPIWIAAYRYRGKSFRFIVNGQTGQVTGERPYSTWKIALAVLAGALAAALTGYLLALQPGAG